MEWYWYIIIGYAIVINLAAVIMTIYDKKAARYKLWRVPERTLLLVAALSGCVVMYVTMRLLHHKTRKPKFMVGIPVIFIGECLLGLFLYGWLAHVFV